MRRSVKMMLRIGIVVALMLTGIGMQVSGQAPSGSAAQGAALEDASFAQIGAPVEVKMEWSSEMPTLTAEQAAQVAACQERTNLSGPVADSGNLKEIAGAVAGTESVMGRSKVQSAQPLAPSDVRTWRNSVLPSGIFPSGLRSNVMESSVATDGKYIFYTGNWFAARSVDGGATWAYVSAFAGMADFCCDQVVIYDQARDIIIWERMGVSNASGVNRFLLGISTNGGASFFFYNFAPTGTNSAWTNQWWDYCHMQLGARFLYMSWNMFNAAGNWTRTIMLRLPLDSLMVGAGFSYSYYFRSDWFTFVPIQGAYNTMYFASNWPTSAPQNSRLAIWKWAEDSGAIAGLGINLPAWSATFRGQALCGATSGNWAARYDQRVLSGARYTIESTNIKTPGRAVLGWWWNVKQGGNFARPYIEGAAVYEDTLALVPGLQGRPYMWNSTTCFAYPSAASNIRGALGIVFHYSTGTAMNPSLGGGIADDYVWAPPGWSIFGLRTSAARPTDNKWGDYNTTRMYSPVSEVWAGAGHYLPTSGACCNAASPVYALFGRDRESRGVARWWLN